MSIHCEKNIYTSKEKPSQALMAHACNPSYSGGSDQEARLGK
jgi:hypothetical protein